jgi:hypothetical protein
MAAKADTVEDSKRHSETTNRHRMGEEGRRASDMTVAKPVLRPPSMSCALAERSRCVATAKQPCRLLMHASDLQPLHAVGVRQCPRKGPHFIGPHLAIRIATDSCINYAERLSDRQMSFDEISTPEQGVAMRRKNQLRIFVGSEDRLVSG